MLRFLTMILLLTVGATTFAQTAQNSGNKAADRVKHLKDFQVIEFRRYTVKEGEREHFAEYFESYFPEAFQQMGAIAFGQFFERKNPVGFTWMRGFKNTRSEERRVGKECRYRWSTNHHKEIHN